MTALGMGAAKLVKAEILNNLRSDDVTSIWSMVPDIGNGVADKTKGDTVDMPALSALTINADGSQNATPDQPTLTGRQLIVDREPLIVVRLNRRQRAQMMGGGDVWSQQIGKAAALEIENHLDRDLLDFGMLEAAVGGALAATPQTVINPAGLTVTAQMFLEARTILAQSRGSSIRRLAIFCDVWGEAAIHLLPGFTAVQLPPGGSADKLSLGFSLVGTFHGIPVFLTNENPGSVARNAIALQAFSVATTASVISGGGVTQTLTVLPGHGIVPGMVGTTAGLTNDANGHNGAGRVVASVTDTSIVLTIVGGTNNAAADGVGTFTPRSSFSLMVDLGKFFKGVSDDTLVEIVTTENNTGLNLKVSPLFGRQSYPGAFVAIGNPRGALIQA